MNVLPIVSRELRVQARQPMTFWLRAIGVVALMLAAALYLIGNPGQVNVGTQLFGHLHTALFFSVLVLVPFSAMDCLSRERREGTLGLLLLTPLTAASVVTAKGFAHATRALTLVVAVFPVFMLPLLLGGVSWQQVATTVLLIFSALCLALGATMLASAWNRRRSGALVWSALLTAGAWLGFSVVLGYLVMRSSRSGFQFRSSIYSLDYLLLTGTSLSMGFGVRFARWMPSNPLLVAVMAATIVAAGWLILATVFTARRIRRVWREEPPSEQTVRLQRLFTTPIVWLKFYKRWMRRVLERNPIGWLERRTWQGRLVTWVWFAVVVSVFSNLLSYRNMARGFSELARLMAWGLVISMAATVAGSFRRERETGVLELLLITPMAAGRIVRGRLLGLWGQFLPATGSLLVMWAYLSSLMREQGYLPTILFFLVTFLTLPVIGLHFSVRCKSFVTAFLLTITVSTLLPLLAGEIGVRYLLSPHAYQVPGRYETVYFLLVVVSQLALAGLFLHRLRRRLVERSFPMERTMA